MKLNKIICIFCAVLILVITCANISISAYATLGTALWSTWDAADEAAQQLAQLYHKTAAAMDNTKAFKQAYPNWYDLPIEWICSHVDVASDIAEAGITATYLLTPAGDLYYYIDELGNLCVYERVGAGGASRYGSSGGGGRPKTVDSSSDSPIFSGENYSDIIRRLNEQYGIKGTKEYISIRTDKRYDPSTKVKYGPISFFENGEFCGQTNWLECYIIPFYYDGSKYWYNLMERHYTQEVVAADDGNHVYMHVNVFSLVDDSVSYTETIGYNNGTVPLDISNRRYADISSYQQYTGRPSLIFYTTYSNYVSKTSGVPYEVRFTDYDISGLYSLQNLYSEDSLAAGTYDTYKTINDVYANAYSSDEDYVEGIDFGYFVSNEPIEMGLNWTGIDPEKIDPDLAVSMDGDTIYNCSVTNINGDTTTINEYVTNNYTININNSNGDSDGGESGGTVGGNVNVSGDIDVGGQVDVNVNINDNNSSMPVEVDVENYLEVIPEQAKPVTNILALFFDFLPVELLSLILAGVAVAIILRIWGR